MDTSNPPPPQTPDILEDDMNQIQNKINLDSHRKR